VKTFRRSVGCNAHNDGQGPQPACQEPEAAREDDHLARKEGGPCDQVSPTGDEEDSSSPR
jgi:hypothetical protein